MKYFLSLLILLTSCTSQKQNSNTAEGNVKQEAINVMKSKEGLQIIHQNFAAACFNKTWEYIEKKDLSEEDIEDMITASYASLFHWKKRNDCTDMNLSIAYWQLGRVHCLANKTGIAKEFGEKCLKVSKDQGPFAKGYAYEVLLNAAVLEKDKKSAVKYLKLAKEQLADVKDKENYGYLSKDLEKLEKQIN